MLLCMHLRRALHVGPDDCVHDNQNFDIGLLACRHEDGMNYNRILPDLIVGSCLQVWCMPCTHACLYVASMTSITGDDRP